MQQHRLVDQQFGQVAQAYLTSAVHAQGADLDALAALAQSVPQAKVLDLGCGGGHVSFAMAPHVAAVVAYDLSEDMLGVVAAEAARRGLAQLHTQAGRAEALPFDDAAFDIVATRFSAHHWYDVRKGLAEARRVLKPGGKPVIVDIVAPEAPLLTPCCKPPRYCAMHRTCATTGCRNGRPCWLTPDSSPAPRAPGS